LTKFLVVFDVDSTLIEQEAIELLAAHSASGEKVKEITDRAMRGEIDFSQSLIERVATLKGLPDSVLAEVSNALSLTNGAKELVAEIHSRGGKAAAVSGGFIQLLDPIRSELQLDFAAANTLGVSEGKLTGEVVGEIVNRQAKADYLLQWAASCGLNASRTIAVGDGANDLGMMAVAGLSVAFCAKPIVNQQADIVLAERNLARLIEILP
jgi:phosphoserine phosphatase